MHIRSLIFAGTALAALAAPTASAAAPEEAETAETAAVDDGAIVVTARRRAENVQDVPVAISVVDGATLDSKGVFNINRLTQLQPSLQFFSTNPRNTFINIRGIGVPYGLTSDGFEQGVGIYVDDVYNSRVAAATCGSTGVMPSVAL